MTNLETFFLVLWVVSGVVTAFRVSKPLTKNLMDYNTGNGDYPSFFAVALFTIVLCGGCISSMVYIFCVGIKD